MKKLLFLSLLILASCQNKKDFLKGKQILEDQGYTNVLKLDTSYGCCDENDTSTTSFKAWSPKGKEVYGCFCSSFRKGLTIRYQ